MDEVPLPYLDCEQCVCDLNNPLCNIKKDWIWVQLLEVSDYLMYRSLVLEDYETAAKISKLV